jgi:hypothetical protein
VLLVVAASAIVAIAATGAGLLLPAVQLEDGWVRVVRLAGAAAAMGGLAALLVQRKRLRAVQDPRSDPTVAALLAAGTIMGALVLMALLAPGVVVEEDASLGGAGSVGDVASDSGDPEAESRRSSSRARGMIGGFGLARAGAATGGRTAQRPAGDDLEDGEADVDPGRAGILLLLVLVLAMVAMGVLVYRARPGYRGQGPSPDVPVAPAEAEAGLEASLVEVAHEGLDPRQQITAAYHRLLAALAAAGSPRQPHEAPHEHLNRTLGPLGVQPAPMHRLAELYVIAQFSAREITERHRSGAAAALEAGLMGLRKTRRGPVAGADERVPETAGA